MEEGERQSRKKSSWNGKIKEKRKRTKKNNIVIKGVNWREEN